MIIDVHAHHHPRQYIAAQAELGGRGGRHYEQWDTDDEEHIEARLRMMEEAGVGIQVLSPAAPSAPYGGSEAAAVTAARLVNDSYEELTRRYPDKFQAFASLPLPHLDASVAELARSLDDLGMIGVNLHASVFDRSIADDEFLPIFEAINDRRGVIFFHPAGTNAAARTIREHGLGGGISAPIEDAILVAHLIIKQIPTKFPDITYIIPHYGGPIPMLLQRLDNHYQGQYEFPEPPSVTAKRFIYDTAQGGPPALRCALEAFGADHLVCGSDYARPLSWQTYASVFSWIRDCGLSEDVVAQIEEGNARAVLRLP